MTFSNPLHLDEIDGLIAETQIANDSISTPKLKANAVTADILEAEAITAKHTITGALFQTLAQALRGIKMDSTGIRGYDSSGNLKFQLDNFSSTLLARSLQLLNNAGAVTDIPTGIGLYAYNENNPNDYSIIEMKHDDGIICRSRYKVTFGPTEATPTVVIQTVPMYESVEIHAPIVADALAASPDQSVPSVATIDSAGYVTRWTNAPQRPITGSGSLASGTVIAAGSFVTITCNLDTTADKTPRWADCRRTSLPSGSSYLVLEVSGFTTSTVTVRIRNLYTSNITLGGALNIGVVAFV